MSMIHRILKQWGFRKAWREGIHAGVIEVTKLRAKHESPKEHVPSEGIK